MPLLRTEISPAGTGAPPPAQVDAEIFSADAQVLPSTANAKDGTIDVIATDHAPHGMDEKSGEFDYAPFGIVGLETALGLSLRLVKEKVLTLQEVVCKLSLNPAFVLKIVKGTLKAGADADITIIDPNLEWTVDTSLFRSRSKNTPFNGSKLQGRAVQTIVGGKV